MQVSNTGLPDNDHSVRLYISSSSFHPLYIYSIYTVRHKHGTTLAENGVKFELKSISANEIAIKTVEIVHFFFHITINTFK